MGSPCERYAAPRFRKEKRREERLENEQCGAGGPYVEGIIAWFYLARGKGELR